MRWITHLSDQELLLHVLRLYGSQQLHGFIQTLAGLQFLLGSQHAFQQNQAHPEHNLHSWQNRAVGG